MRIRPFLLGLVLVIPAVLAPGRADGQTGHAHGEEDISAASLRITWADFKKLHDANKAVVVDVRPAPSFEAGHIPGSLSIPLDEIGKHAAALKKRNRPIVLYCA